MISLRIYLTKAALGLSRWLQSCLKSRLVKLETCLRLSDYQFGVKCNHSTDMHLYSEKGNWLLQISSNVNVCVFYGCPQYSVVAFLRLISFIVFFAK